MNRLRFALRSLAIAAVLTVAIALAVGVVVSIVLAIRGCDLWGPRRRSPPAGTRGPVGSRGAPRAAGVGPCAAIAVDLAVPGGRQPAGNTRPRGRRWAIRRPIAAAQPADYGATGGPPGRLRARIGPVGPQRPPTFARVGRSRATRPYRAAGRRPPTRGQGGR